jgi:predicted phage terminase large subunit-like protein
MIERIEKTARLNDTLPKLKHICLPAEVSDKIKPKHLKRYYKKGLMDPIRLPRAVLNEQLAYGDYHYAGQYMQWPVPLGGGMFKTGKIRIETDVPTKWLRICRFWDKAGTEGGKGAFTVGLLLALDREGRWWILDVQRGRWGSSEREKKIKQIAEIDGYGVMIGIEQEPGSGGKESAENTIRNLAGWRVFIDKPSGAGSSKELRADPASVQVNNGNVYLKRADWNIDFISELSFFPYSKYKDQVDAFSGAFNKLAKKGKRAGALFSGNRE